jgi:hypothetical protein
MSVFLGKNQQHYTTVDQEKPDVASPGEKLAAAIVVFMAATYLVISIWSGVVLLAGNTENGGPIGIICRLIHPV